MADQVTLSERFDYDLWANKLWLEALQNKNEPASNGVFAHILSAQDIWRQRCRGFSPEAMPVVTPSASELERLNIDWKAIISETDHNQVVVFRRTTGQQLELPLFKIAAHVLNHGTYHRGELRGLCRARADDDFPETDMGGWFFASRQ